MNKREAKKYIKKHWNTSNGQRIKEMLLRYWKMEEVDIVAEAKKIFGTA